MPLFLDRTHVGLQAGDVLRIVQYLQARPDVGTISVACYNNLASAVLHAVATTSVPVERVAVIASIATYAMVAGERYYDMPHWMEMHGTLTGYDLPDLAAALAPRPLLLAFPTDQLQRPLSPETAQTSYAFAAGVYAAQGHGDRLRVVSGGYSEQAAVLALQEWLLL